VPLIQAPRLILVRKSLIIIYYYYKLLLIPGKARGSRLYCELALTHALFPRLRSIWNFAGRTACYEIHGAAETLTSIICIPNPLAVTESFIMHHEFQTTYPYNACILVICSFSCPTTFGIILKTAR
jgi:hypothetical protein